MYQRALSLAPAAAATGALLLVNDRVDVAMTVGAAGVQLGRRSLPVADARRLLGERAWIGWSAHGAAEAAQAEADGADFCVVGTVYQTTSHTDRPPLGLAPFGAIARRLARPAIAIGGITPARVAEVIAAGAAGVAVLSGVWHAHDPLAAADEYRRALEGAGKP